MVISFAIIHCYENIRHRAEKYFGNVPKFLRADIIKDVLKVHKAKFYHLKIFWEVPFWCLGVSPPMCRVKYQNITPLPLRGSFINPVNSQSSSPSLSNSSLSLLDQEVGNVEFNCAMIILDRFHMLYKQIGRITNSNQTIDKYNF